MLSPLIEAVLTLGESAACGDPLPEPVRDEGLAEAAAPWPGCLPLPAPLCLRALLVVFSLMETT